jgi:hypothetical protein
MSTHLRNSVAKRQLGKRDFRAGAMTSHFRSKGLSYVYVVARRRAAILSDCNGSGRRDVTVLLSNAMTVARVSLTQFGYIN